MKKLIFVTALILCFASPVFAIPNLQLWFDPALNPGAVYDSIDAGWETGQNPAILSGLIHNQTGNTGISITDTFRLYVSLPNIASGADPNGNYSASVANPGSYDPASLDTSGISPWVYGNPGIPSHGIFDSWYAFYDFTIDSDNAFLVDNVETSETPVNGWRADFEITFAGNPASLFHFDLVDLTTGIGPGNSGYVNVNPFSHDAQSDNGGGGGGGGGGGNPVPEPSTLILLGAGVVGLALYRRRQ